jgi:hypothetical protein
MIALALYFILSFYYGRKNPMFYLIVVFALQQGQAAFIDQSIAVAGKNIFSTYDMVFVDVLFFITTIISILFIRAKFPRTDYMGSKLVMAHLLYIVFLFIITLVSYHDKGEVILSGRQLLYISLSYFLWISIFHVVTREQYEEFLKVLFYVTPVSAVLYILNSSGKISIFDKELIYMEIEGQSGVFFRDFATIPTQLVPLFVISFLSLITPTFKLPKWLIMVNMVVLPVAVLFTFTRSILLGIGIQLVVLIVLYSYGNSKKMFRQLFTFFAIILLFVPTFFVAQNFYPEAIGYFTERLTDAAVEKENDENVDIRLAYLEKVIEITKETSVFIGAGLNRQYYPQMNAIGAWTADSTIPLILYHTGWIGVVLLYAILLFFIVDSVLYFKKTNDWMVAFISSSIITSTFSSLLMGGAVFTGTVWTFMYLALYSTIRLNTWKKPKVSLSNSHVTFNTVPSI